MLNLPELYLDLYVVIESLYKKHTLEDTKVNRLRKQLELIGSQMNENQHREFRDLLLAEKKLEMLHEQD